MKTNPYRWHKTLTVVIRKDISADDLKSVIDAIELLWDVHSVKENILTTAVKKLQKKK